MNAEKPCVESETVSVLPKDIRVTPKAVPATTCNGV